MAVIAARRSLRRRSGRRLRLASQGPHPPMTSWVPDPGQLIVAAHSHTTEPVTVPGRPRSRPASAPTPAAAAVTARALTIHGRPNREPTPADVSPHQAATSHGLAASWYTRPRLATCGDTADAPETRSHRPGAAHSSAGTMPASHGMGGFRSGASGPLRAVTPAVVCERFYARLTPNIYRPRCLVVGA
jgi:hypothetical protein